MNVALIALAILAAIAVAVSYVIPETSPPMRKVAYVVLVGSALLYLLRNAGP